MAKIQSDGILIEISRIAKDDEQLESIVSQDMLAMLEQVVNELVGTGAVVEVKGTE